MVVFKFLLMSCSTPHRTGKDTADTLLLNDVPEIVHISEAFGMNAHASLLLHPHQDRGSTPTPSPFFFERPEQVQNHVVIQSSTSPTALTFNTGLADALNERYPHVENRRKGRAEIVFGLADILFLQGIWRTEDANRLRSYAAQKSYAVHGGLASTQKKHGFMVFVRSNIVDCSCAIVEDIYCCKAARENSAALVWQLEHRQSDQDLLLLNTCVDQSLKYHQVRILQDRQNGLLMQEKQPEQISVLGVDWAFGPYCPSNYFEQAGGGTSENWSVQSEAYSLWLTHGGFRDAVLQGDLRLPGAILAPLGMHSGALAKSDLAIE